MAMGVYKMNWIGLIQKITIAGMVISLIVVTIFYNLWKKELNDPKNYNKLLEDTPVPKYMMLFYSGLILSSIFQLIFFITGFF